MNRSLFAWLAAAALACGALLAFRSATFPQISISGDGCLFLRKSHSSGPYCSADGRLGSVIIDIPSNIIVFFDQPAEASRCPFALGSSKAGLAMIRIGYLQGTTEVEVGTVPRRTNSLYYMQRGHPIIVCDLPAGHASSIHALKYTNVGAERRATYEWAEANIPNSSLEALRRIAVRMK